MWGSSRWNIISSWYVLLYVWILSILIDTSIYIRLLYTHRHLDQTERPAKVHFFQSCWFLDYLTSAEKVPTVCASVWNPWCGHWQPLHECHDGTNGARHWWCNHGGLRRPGGEDLLGRHQNPNHQTGLHQWHTAGDHHFLRWVHFRYSSNVHPKLFW